MDPILAGSLASLAAGLATGLGALAVFVKRRPSPRQQDLLLGFAAGVMLAASFFSLLLPAIERAAASHPGSMVLPALIATAGLLLGAGAIAFANERIPHRHPVQGAQGPTAPALSRIQLFVLAITIHNFPEGIAVGVGYAGGDPAGASALAIGIGLQNIPEGLAVAVALVSAGASRWKAFAVGTATGLVEPIGGILGAAIVGVFAPVLPWALAFAAGAMIYIVSQEIIPETHSRGNQRQASAGLICGLGAMMFLDVAFG